MFSPVAQSEIKWVFFLSDKHLRKQSSKLKEKIEWMEETFPEVLLRGGGCRVNDITEHLDMIRWGIPWPS